MCGRMLLLLLLYAAAPAAAIAVCCCNYCCSMLLLVLLARHVWSYATAATAVRVCCYPCFCYCCLLLQPLQLYTTASTVGETQRARLLAHPIPVLSDDAHHFAELLAHVQLVRVQDQKNQVRTFREPFHNLSR